MEDIEDSSLANFSSLCICIRELGPLHTNQHQLSSMTV